MTLLSLLIGFITSNIPALMKFFQNKQDNKHELQMLALQLQYNKANLDTRLEEVRINTELAGLQTRLLTTNVGNVWIDGINALVRPITAFVLLFMYCVINYIYYDMLKDVASPSVFADLMWTEADQNFLGAIIGYYFGGRLSEKFK